MTPQEAIDDLRGSALDWVATPRRNWYLNMADCIEGLSQRIAELESELAKLREQRVRYVEVERGGKQCSYDLESVYVVINNRREYHVELPPMTEANTVPLEKPELLPLTPAELGELVCNATHVIAALDGAEFYVADVSYFKGERANPVSVLLAPVTAGNARVTPGELQANYRHLDGSRIGRMK